MANWTTYYCNCNCGGAIDVDVDSMPVDMFFCVRAPCLRKERPPFAATSCRREPIEAYAKSVMGYGKDRNTEEREPRELVIEACRQINEELDADFKEHDLPF